MQLLFSVLVCCSALPLACASDNAFATVSGQRCVAVHMSAVRIVFFILIFYPHTPPQPHTILHVV